MGRPRTNLQSNEPAHGPEHAWARWNELDSAERKLVLDDFVLGQSDLHVTAAFSSRRRADAALLVLLSIFQGAPGWDYPEQFRELRRLATSPLQAEELSAIVDGEGGGAGSARVSDVMRRLWKLEPKVYRRLYEAANKGFRRFHAWFLKRHPEQRERLASVMPLPFPLGIGFAIGLTAVGLGAWAAVECVAANRESESGGAKLPNDATTELEADHGTGSMGSGHRGGGPHRSQGRLGRGSSGSCRLRDVLAELMPTDALNCGDDEIQEQLTFPEGSPLDEHFTRIQTCIIDASKAEEAFRYMRVGGGIDSLVEGAFVGRHVDDNYYIEHYSYIGDSEWDSADARNPHVKVSTCKSLSVASDCEAGMDYDRCLRCEEVEAYSLCEYGERIQRQ